jgi:NAD(P)H-nitrite reductase large subunit
VVGDEREPPYSRMAIPYLLMGNVDERHLSAPWHALRRAAHHAAQWPRQMRWTRKGRTVTLENGSTLAFDRLLIATGSSAR